MSILSSIYQGVFKRSSTFVVAIAFGAIGVWKAFLPFFFSLRIGTNANLFSLQFERGFDSLADYIWETKNQGKLWKVWSNLAKFLSWVSKLSPLQDIRHKYENKEEEEE